MTCIHVPFLHRNFSPVKVHVINLGNTSSQYRVVETTANPIKQCTAVYQTHRLVLCNVMSVMEIVPHIVNMSMLAC